MTQTQTMFILLIRTLVIVKLISPSGALSNFLSEEMGIAAEREETITQITYPAYGAPPVYVSQNFLKIGEAIIEIDDIKPTSVACFDFICLLGSTSQTIQRLEYNPSNRYLKVKYEFFDAQLEELTGKKVAEMQFIQNSDYFITRFEGSSTLLRWNLLVKEGEYGIFRSPINKNIQSMAQIPKTKYLILSHESSFRTTAVDMTSMKEHSQLMLGSLGAGKINMMVFPETFLINNSANKLTVHNINKFPYLYETSTLTAESQILDLAVYPSSSYLAFLESSQISFVSISHSGQALVLHKYQLTSLTDPQVNPALLINPNSGLLLYSQGGEMFYELKAIYQPEWKSPSCSSTPIPSFSFSSSGCEVCSKNAIKENEQCGVSIKNDIFTDSLIDGNTVFTNGILVGQTDEGGLKAPHVIIGIVVSLILLLAVIIYYFTCTKKSRGLERRRTRIRSLMTIERQFMRKMSTFKLQKVSQIYNIDEPKIRKLVKNEEDIKNIGWATPCGPEGEHEPSIYEVVLVQSEIEEAKSESEISVSQRDHSTVSSSHVPHVVLSINTPLTYLATVIRKL